MRGRLTPLQALAVARERVLWGRRADTWDDAGSAGLSKVVEAVLAQAGGGADMVALDMGAGTGQVTIPLAETCGRVLAVDVSAPLLQRLSEKAAERGVRNIELLTQPLESFDLPEASLDLVVSNYTLHHLRDPDKQRLMQRAHAWLRPGGRIVIGDMMFGRGVASEDRAIIASKMAVLLRRGPAGWWRLLKNAARFSFRVREKPLTPGAWEALAQRAGFTDVSVVRVVSEACVLTAVKSQTSQTAPAHTVTHGAASSVTAHADPHGSAAADGMARGRLRSVVRGQTDTPVTPVP